MRTKACALALLALSPALAGCAAPAPPSGNATAAADDATVASLRAELANATAQRGALQAQLNQTLAYNAHLLEQTDLLTKALDSQRALTQRVLDANAQLSAAYNRTIVELNDTMTQLQQCQQNTTK